MSHAAPSRINAVGFEGGMCSITRTFDVSMLSDASTLGRSSFADDLVSRANHSCGGPPIVHFDTSNSFFVDVRVSLVRVLVLFRVSSPAPNQPCTFPRHRVGDRGDGDFRTIMRRSPPISSTNEILLWQQ